MKFKILFTLLLLALANKGLSQSVEDYIAGGRGSLVTSNITAANSLFSAAVNLETSNQEANTLLAVTRLLVLPSQSGGSGLLTKLGIPAQGRNIYNWTAVQTNDADGVPIAPDNVSTAEVVTYVRTSLLPSLNNSILNLSRVTEPNFTLQLSESETKISSVTLDYGDVLMIKSMLHGIKFIALTITAHNCEAQLTTIRALYTGEMTMEHFLSGHPEFLTFAQLSDLNDARTAFEEAVDTYLLASQFVRNRPLGQVRLFSYDVDSADDELTFRQVLTSVKASLNSAAVLVTDTNYVVHMGAYYSGLKAIREFLPTFKSESFVLGTLKDITFGQTILGLTEGDIENFLTKFFKALPNITSVGLSGNVFSFKMHGLKENEYTVQVSSDLQNWVDTEAVTVPGGVMIIQDNVDQQFRFYRILDLSAYISLQGQVIDYNTGNPVPGAQITTSLESTSVYTDSEGKFFLQTRTPAEIENEYYTIRIVASGFTTVEEGRWWGARLRGHAFYLSSLPVNDDFANRSVIESVASGISIGATREFGEPWHYFNTGGKSVWWLWKSTSSGFVTITTAGSNFDTILAVYVGSTLHTLTQVANDDDSGPGLTSMVQFYAVSGQTYQIAVDGWGGGSGLISLQITP